MSRWVFGPRTGRLQLSYITRLSEMKKLLSLFILSLLSFVVSGQIISGDWKAERISASGVTVESFFHFDEKGSVEIIISAYIPADNGAKQGLHGTVHGSYSIEGDIVSMLIENQSVDFNEDPAIIYTNPFYESFRAYVSMLPSESVLKIGKVGDSVFLESEEWGQLTALAADNKTNAETATQETAAEQTSSQEETQRVTDERADTEKSKPQKIASASPEQTGQTDGSRIDSKTANVNHGNERQEASDQPSVILDGQTRVKEHIADVSGIYRKGSKLYRSDSKTLVTINDLYDASSWESYQKGAALMKTGNCCLVVGGVSAALVGTAIVYTNYDTSDSVMMNFKESGLGVAATLAVPICAAAGIALRIIGRNMINRVVNTQNGTVMSSVSLGATPNGIGLAFNF